MSMHNEIEAALFEIGGNQLVASWEEEYVQTEVKLLPTAQIDSLAISYSLAIGLFATAVDHVLDASFREEMHQTHRERTPTEQKDLEDKAKEILKEAGDEKRDPGGPNTGMDWYQGIKTILNTRVILRPSNHRILNHTNEKEVIEMLMNGEAGLGEYKVGGWPKMSFELAKRVYDAHIAADRGTKQSLPLAFMSWFWEQGMKVAHPEELGKANAIYEFLSKRMPDVDWAKWVNNLFGQEGLIPEGSTFAEVMIKLYDSGVLNQRVFWTSNLGAAVGGAKRRATIAAMMELGVEIYAFLEGIRLGHVNYRADLATLGKDYAQWRDQPKYIDMRIVAQIGASSGGILKAGLKGDVLNINFFALGMTFKHLWGAPKVSARHTDRLVAFSQDHVRSLVERFTEETGIVLPSGLALEMDEDLIMRGKSLDDRLHEAGCQSTRVRVLATRYPERMEPLVEIYERWMPKAEVDLDFQDRFDTLCETWYLSSEEDDEEALSLLRHDLRRLSDGQ